MKTLNPSPTAVPQNTKWRGSPENPNFIFLNIHLRKKNGRLGKKLDLGGTRQMGPLWFGGLWSISQPEFLLTRHCAHGGIFESGIFSRLRIIKLTVFATEYWSRIDRESVTRIPVIVSISRCHF